MDLGDDDKVRKLPVRFKMPMPEGRSLVALHEVPKAKGCAHLFVQYIVDPSLAEVECRECGAKLNPMWVLTRLRTDDRRHFEAQKRYQEEMKRLAERERTKCHNCGHMTRISRR